MENWTDWTLHSTIKIFSSMGISYSIIRSYYTSDDWQPGALVSFFNYIPGLLFTFALCYISALSHNHQHHHHPHSRNYKNGSLIYAIVSEPRVNAAPLGGLRVRSGSKSEHVKIAFRPGLVPRNPIRSKFVINKAASHSGVRK